jgi:hypothetical protein|tara:strand:+ start:846 stop:1049 length:204 start_codon:yes stop_codon:yes gene_type:complete
MEVFYIICGGLSVFAVVVAIERVSTELRGIRTVMMEHAQLEPVPVHEHDPASYQRRDRQKASNPPAC